MSLQAIRFFQPLQLRRLVESLEEKLVIDQPLLFLDRAYKATGVPDNELFGKFTGNVFAADLIAEDAQAVTYEAGKFSFSTATNLKLKIGYGLTESQVEMLARIYQGINVPGDSELLGNSLSRVVDGLLRGVRQRKNAMLAAMFLNGFNYDRLGFKVSAGFGLPSALNVTVATDWDNAAATPITDLETLIHEVGPDQYGRSNWNRITLAKKVIRAIFKTTEFQDRLKTVRNLNVASPAFNYKDFDAMSAALSNILGIQVVAHDTTYAERSPDGTIVRTRVVPASKVILDSSEDDNNPAAYDLASSIVPESRLASLIPGAPDLGGPRVGPIVYPTGDPSLNPGTLQMWAVDKCFPRKHDDTLCAVLSVGAGFDA